MKLDKYKNVPLEEIIDVLYTTRVIQNTRGEELKTYRKWILILAKEFTEKNGGTYVGIDLDDKETKIEKCNNMDCTAYTVDSHSFCKLYDNVKECAKQNLLLRGNEDSTTYFQRLIINCKPEIGKPVFILSGAGSGKTEAINQRAKSKNLINIHPMAGIKNRHFCKDYNFQYSTKIEPNYEEYVFEPITDVETFLKISEHNKVIGFCTPLFFINNIGPYIKGEYTIISGFNLYDNPYLPKNYIDCVESLRNDRNELMGKWGN